MMADEQNKQTGSAAETDAKFSQPVTNVADDPGYVRPRTARTEEQDAELTPAPAGGAEGSNFAGGTDGQENPVVAGREDERAAAEATQTVAAAKPQPKKKK